MEYTTDEEIDTIIRQFKSLTRLAIVTNRAVQHLPHKVLTVRRRLQEDPDVELPTSRYAYVMAKLKRFFMALLGPRYELAVVTTVVIDEARGWHLVIKDGLPDQPFVTKVRRTLWFRYRNLYEESSLQDFLEDEAVHYKDEPAEEVGRYVASLEAKLKALMPEEAEAEAQAEANEIALAGILLCGEGWSQGAIDSTRLN